MKVRRLTFVLVFVFFALLAGAPRAADPCTDGLMPFQEADLFFSNAERADASAAKQLWTSVRFALEKVTVIEHGLSVGYAFAGLSADDAQKRANQLLDAAAYEARGKGSLGEVYMAWRQNERSLYDRTLSYLARFQRGADAAIIARHNPSGPDSAPPNVDVEAPNPITPEFPEEAKASTMHDMTVRAKVAVDATGKHARRGETDDVSPKIAECKAVPGTYVFRATFDPLH